LLLLLLLVPPQLCRSSLHLRRRCKQKNTAKILLEFLWKTKEKTLCKKIKKTISVQQLQSSEEKKREKLCLRSTFVSSEETEEKRVRLVGTSMFFLFCQFGRFSQI
jgi:hypothetical protein